MHVFFAIYLLIFVANGAFDVLCYLWCDGLCYIYDLLPALFSAVMCHSILCCFILYCTMLLCCLYDTAIVVGRRHGNCCWLTTRQLLLADDTAIGASVRRSPPGVVVGGLVRRVLGAGAGA